jgi:tryptophan synthase alpha chain
MSGTDRIHRAFRRARDEKRLAFVPYITAGDPDLDGTRRLTAALAGAGADVLELGVPWIRPTVDGPVMPRKRTHLPGSSMSLDALLTSLPVIKSGADIPMVVSCDLESILELGEEVFAERAAAAGADGVLLADAPGPRLERARSALEARGIATVFLVTPDSSEEHLQAIPRSSGGFVHVASPLFLDNDDLARKSLLDLAARLREQTRLPVALGLGVSTAKQVSGLCGAADAFVAGNALEAIVDRLGAGDEGIVAVATLARKLSAACSEA